MPLRGEFEVEYENEAEALISPLTFDPDDTPDETELKYQVLELYRYLFRRQKKRTKLKWIHILETLIFLTKLNSLA